MKGGGIVAGTDGRCCTKYPILLIHGANCRDFRPWPYWGRVPGLLRQNGAMVYHGGQDAWGTVDGNALVLKERVLEIAKDTGCKKLNLIAHSKGGLEARYMINKLGMDSYTASLTTLSTPHRGSKTADAFLDKLPYPLQNLIAGAFNMYAKLLGDKNPHSLQVCHQLTTSYCSQFNKDAPNLKDIYYQSYYSAMKSWHSDIIMSIPYLIIKQFDGDNDGLVNLESAKWGNFRGVLKSKTRRGISHSDIVDSRKRNFGSFNIAEFYVNLVEELKEMGL